jgi:hypothetical protein
VVVSQKVRFLIKAQAGVLYAHSPELNGCSRTDTASAVMKQNSSSAWGFIYSAGGGISYDLNQKVYFTSQLVYTGTNEIPLKT